jgi:hypothetical protein
MILTSAVEAQQIVEFSIYDEFGDIMRNSPGMLVENDRFNRVELDQDTDLSQELDQFRYRSDRLHNREENNLTSYGNNRFGAAKQVWKFRPLDEEKEKKVIKIDEKPVRDFQQPWSQPQPPQQLQQPQPQLWSQSWSQRQRQPWTQPQYYRPYSPYTMTPVPIAPMMPIAPPLMSPGMMYRYPLYPY